MASAKKISALAIATVLAASLGACGASDSAKEKSSEAKKSESITVLVHDSFDLPKELIEKFEKESGYTLHTQSAGDAGVVNTLLVQQGKGDYDAAYGVTEFSAYNAIDGNVFDSYTSDKFPSDALAQPIENALTPIDLGDVCVNVDHEWFKQNGQAEPQSMQDLAKPEYASKLVGQNPATSDTGFAFLAATISSQGTEGFRDYWKQLLTGGMRIAGGWSDSYYTDFSGSEGKGAYPLVVSYSASPAETGGATGIIPSTCVRQVEYAGVVKGAKNPEGAHAFIDFLLSEDVQKALPESMYMYPVNPSVPLPEAWAQHATLTQTPLAVDDKEVARERENWVKQWQEVFEAQ